MSYESYKVKDRGREGSWHVPKSRKKTGVGKWGALETGRDQMVCGLARMMRRFGIFSKGKAKLWEGLARECL